MEQQAAEFYASTFAHNIYSVGFVINPSACHLGASPDRRVYDPSADDSFGLLEVKCPVATSLSQVKYFQTLPSGERLLKKPHAYYYQIMGQLGVTGAAWCDFFVYTETEYHIERIVYDTAFFADMKEKLDVFYFSYFLPKFISK